MLRKVMVRWSLTAALAGITLAPAAAQEPGSQQSQTFVQAAAQSDQFEIMEGYTAVTASGDPAIRTFAQQMIRDHDETSRTLEQAAARAGLPPPPKGMSEDQAHMLGALQSLSGPEFDKTYLQQQALAHRSALVVEQAYAASGDEPNLRTAAATAIPLITAHLEMAEHTRAKRVGS